MARRSSRQTISLQGLWTWPASGQTAQP